MYCPKCGGELPEDANFCPNCDAKVTGIKHEISHEVKPETPIQPTAASKQTEKKEGRGILFWLLAGIGGIVVIFFLFSIIAAFIYGVASSSGYVTISYSGSSSRNIGDTIYFSGTDTTGGTEVWLSMTGPGISDAGVPLTNPDQSGYVNSVSTYNSGWSYTWDTSLLRDKNLQTGTYTITAKSNNGLKSSYVTLYLTASTWHSIWEETASFTKSKAYICTTCQKGDYLKISIQATKPVSWYLLDSSNGYEYQNNIRDDTFLKNNAVSYNQGVAKTTDFASIPQDGTYYIIIYNDSYNYLTTTPINVDIKIEKYY